MANTLAALEGVSVELVLEGQSFSFGSLGESSGAVIILEGVGSDSGESS